VAVLAFVAGRVVWALILVFVISVMTFALFFALPPNAPGSNRQGQVTPNLQVQFNLDGRASFVREYGIFLDRVALHGDLGQSLRQPRSVREIIGRALPVTASLVIGGTILCALLSFAIGLFSALRPRSLVDKGLMVVVLIGISVHPVWISLVLSYLLGFKLNVFPVAGYCDFFYHPSGSNLCGGPRYWAYHMILPWFTFALLFAALYARMIRAGVIEALSEDYVRTAWAKGAGTWRVMRSHALRNAILPVVTIVGMNMGLAFGGALFIETAFQLPGMGQVLYRALTSSDLPVIMGVVLVVSVAITIANTLADVVYCLIDPRLGFRRLRRTSFSEAVGWRLRPRPQVTESRP
jgi:peptide/nickel transport system permease protein